MTIRVLRVLEYEYRDHAHYERDSATWTHTLPQGRLVGKQPRMVSQVVRVQQVPDTTPTTNDPAQP